MFERKIAILGTAPTYQQAPFLDPTWTVWAHSSGALMFPRVDAWFDLHCRDVWNVDDKKFCPGYRGWLQNARTRVVMQEHYREVPMSLRYPREDVLAAFPNDTDCFTSQTAWMIALALMQGATHLGFYGVHYDYDETERKFQRDGAHYWIGVARGRGVKVTLAKGTPLCKTAWLYGYEVPSEHQVLPPKPKPPSVIKTAEQWGDKRPERQRFIPNSWEMAPAHLRKQIMDAWGVTPKRRAGK